MATSPRHINVQIVALLALDEVGVARPALVEKDAGVREMLATHHSSPEDVARDFARIKPKLAVYTLHTTTPGRYP